MTERKKSGIYLKDNIWAENKPNECTEPNQGQYPFTENDGWGMPFSEAGGSPPERTLMNRNFNKIGALAYDVNRFGSNLPWEATIAYELGALVIGSDNKTYRAVQASTGQDPVNDKRGTYWKFAIFNRITGTDNIEVTADAKNNLTVDTAVNLNTKANANLDNVASGSLVGKFQDGVTTSWEVDAKKLTVEVKDKSINKQKMAKKAIGTTALEDESVIASKLAPDAVLTKNIKNSNVTAPKLASNSVATTNLLDANVTMPKVNVDIKHRLRNLPDSDRPEIFHDVISALVNKENTKNTIINIEIPLKLNKSSKNTPHLYLFHLFGYGYHSKTLIDQKFAGYFFNNSLVNASIHGDLPAAMYLSTDSNLIITIKKDLTYFNPITVHYLDCGISGNFAMPNRLFSDRYDFAERANSYAKITMTAERLFNQSKTYDTAITVNKY